MSDADRRASVGNAGSGIGYEEPLLFEHGRGRVGYSLPALDVPEVAAGAVLGDAALRDDLPGLPELSEVEVVRHFTRLSTWNAAVDLGLYPLGSCTMKYNPKINEKVARLHLDKLGAKLTELTPEQASYIGVPVEGPYKPGHYRY